MLPLHMVQALLTKQELAEVIEEKPGFGMAAPLAKVVGWLKVL